MYIRICSYEKIVVSYRKITKMVTIFYASECSIFMGKSYICRYIKNIIPVVLCATSSHIWSSMESVPNRVETMLGWRKRGERMRWIYLYSTIMYIHHDKEHADYDA
jgi:hypothetical protein